VGCQWKLKDASFRKHLLDFRAQALLTMPTDDDANFHGWVEGQARNFLKEQSVIQGEQGLTS